MTEEHAEYLIPPPPPVMFILSERAWLLDEFQTITHKISNKKVKNDCDYLKYIGLKQYIELNQHPKKQIILYTVCCYSQTRHR